MISPEILGMGAEDMGSLFHRSKEQQKEENAVYRRARSVAEFEDPTRISDLLMEKLGYEEVYQDVASKQASINRDLNLNPEDLTEDVKQGIIGNARHISERTSTPLDIEGDSLDEQISSLTASLSKLEESVKETFKAHQDVARQLDSEMSPNMAAHLAHSYRSINPEMQAQRIDAMGDTEVIRGIYNELGGGAKLDEIFSKSGKAPGRFQQTAARWRGKDTEPFEQTASKLTEDQRNTFREEAKRHILEEGQRESIRIEEEYRSRASEQGEILGRWRSEGGSTNALTKDISALKEKGYVKQDESDKIISNLSDFLESDDASRMAANLVSVNRGDSENYSSLFGYSRAGDQSPQAERFASYSGAGQPPPLNTAGSEEYSNNRFINNEFINNRFSSTTSSAGSSASTGMSSTVSPTSTGMGAASGGGSLIGGGSDGIEGPPGSPQPADSGGNFFGGAALGYNAAQSKLGFGESRGEKPKGKFGQLGGAMKGFGVAGLGLGLLSAGQDLLTPGGRPMAESATSAVGSLAPGVGTAIGGTIGGMAGGIGAIPGAAIGHFAGQAVQPIVSAVGDPYFNFVAQQKGYEQISGENLQGEGATQSGFGDFMGTMNPLGGDTIQAGQRGARISNPFLPTEQINALTESLLELGISTEETAEMVKPLSDVMADFNLSPQLTAMLGRAGMGGGLGVENARFMAQRIQQESGEGFTQQDIAGYVEEAMQTLGPVQGYQQAGDTALGYSGLLSKGGDKADLLFQQSGTVGKLAQSDAALANDPGSMAALGVDPSLSPENPEFQEEISANRVERAKMLVDTLPKDPETGEISAIGRQQLQSMISQPPYNTIFAGMSVDEVEEIGSNKAITPESATNEIKQQKKERRQRENKQKRKAAGIGQQNLNSRWDTETEDEGIRGWINERVPKAFHLSANPRSDEQYDLMNASEEQQQRGGRTDSIGAVAQLAKTNEGFDAEKVNLVGGGTLAEATENQKLMRRLNTGDQKVKVGDKAMTIQEFNVAQQKGEAHIGEKGALRTGQKEQGSGGGSMKIDLTDRAAKLIEVKDVRRDGMAAEVQAAQDRYARNHKGQRLNDSPKYG